MARRQPKRNVTKAENHPKPCSQPKKTRSKQTQEGKLNTRQKRELVLQKQRERMRKLRAKKREDPNKLERLRAKERKVWKKRVREGRVKRVADMTPKEREVVRERRRKSAQKWRMNNKKDKQPKKISHQKQEAKRRVKKANSALHRKLAKETKQRKVLQRALWRERKKTQKLREAVELTRRSAVRKEFRGKKLSPAVQRKLVFSEVMKKELRGALKTCSNSYKAKHALHRLITGKVLKKYKMLKASKCLPKRSRSSVKKAIKKGYGILEYHNAPSEKQLKVQADVKAFFTSDECSAVNPCAKGHVKKNGVTERERKLLKPMVDLHKLFNESSTYTISYSTFCRLRPFYVRPLKVDGRDTCLCLAHVNFQLLVKALYAEKVVGEHSPEAVLNSVCCYPNRTEMCLERTCNACCDNKISYLTDCDNATVHYEKWVRKKVQFEKKTKKGNDKTDSANEKTESQITVKSEFLSTVKELKEQFEKDLKDFLSHEYRILHQIKVIKNLKENLKENEVLFYVDFSENYSCKYSSEVQSVHFGGSRESITLHTGVIFLSEGRQESFCTLSRSPDHDPAAILAHMKPIFSKVLDENPVIDTIHSLSDGPVTQYRGKGMFWLLTKYLPSLFPQIMKIIHNFSEASHGKGIPDGIGGNLKGIADRAVTHGEDVHCFSKFFQVVSAKSSV